MNRQGHNYRPDSRQQSHNAKKISTNYKNRPLREEEMPQQGKSLLPEKIRQIFNPTHQQTLECPRKKPPELLHQPISIVDQIRALKTNQRSAPMQRIYQKAELHPLQTRYQQEHEENHPQEYKNYESASNQQKDRYQNVPQHQAGKPPQDLLKQQQYRVPEYPDNMREPPHQPPHDDQTRKNTQKMVQQNHQTESQNHPKKDQHIDLAQNVQQPPQMPRKDLTTASKVMQQNLQKEDPNDGYATKPRHDQQPPQEYRESSHENSAKKSSHGNPQNIREPPRQPHNDHKNASKMMEQNLQKNGPYEELPRKLATDQLKQQPRQQYRMSGYEHPSQQPHEDQTRKNNLKMMQAQYVDPPQKKMEYRSSPKKDPNDQFKEQTPLMYRVLMPHDDYKNAHKMMLKYLPKQEQLPQKAPNDQFKRQPPQEYRESVYHNYAKKTYHGNPQNMRQQPQQHSRMNSLTMMQENQQVEYQNLHKDPFEGAPSQACQSHPLKQNPLQEHWEPTYLSYEKNPQQIDKNSPKESHNHPKKNPFEGCLPKSPHDQLKKQPPEEYRVSSQVTSDQFRHQAPGFYQNSTEKPAHGIAQNIKQPSQQPFDVSTCKNAPKLLQVEYQKAPQKDSFEAPIQKTPNDHLKQQPPREHLEACYCNSPKQPSHSNQSQKQPFTNAPQEHAQRSSSQIKAPHGRNSNKATVAPVPRARSSSRLVPQKLYTNADDCQPSHMADKAKVKCSPKCCEKHSHKMECKGCESHSPKVASTESTSTESTVISAKNGDELRSMVRNELELQALIMKLSNDAKKGGILNPKQCTHDKTYNSKKLWENAYTRARAAQDKVQQVDYSLTVDNIVSDSVITPMIRQIQRMYIRNLRDEMTLVESLELVPLLVKEVCMNVDNMDQHKL
ncbi:putative mediator of RNA polymerase II transcription subunit 12 isoform X2 [Drosophila subobscura]|uniref:putative mediator of RNA polymerase II transcription subunit 12 isoform X2 n=1 Tax=Drosophila subobscura TaxID=7241 RepID=UPI00155A9CA5|nr:putative mediator of RNA polymerase II transcription subunit 12 isoform X2 [Drosophila subobscura]